MIGYHDSTIHAMIARHHDDLLRMAAQERLARLARSRRPEPARQRGVGEVIARWMARSDTSQRRLRVSWSGRARDSS